MLGWEDIYNVLVAMAPLYFALTLGYGSVRWWHILGREQLDAINRFVCYFAIPLFTFDFTSRINPFALNYRFLAADCIAKSIILIVLAIWVKFITRIEGKSKWGITIFSICSVQNTLIIGLPTMKGMYGSLGADLIIQATVLQTIFWMQFVIVVLEIQRMLTSYSLSSTNTSANDHDVEGNGVVNGITAVKPSLVKIMMKRAIWMKFALHPNIYPCVLGIVWALISHRWHVELPRIMEGCVKIISSCGTGVSMFSLGFFMALQEKIVACGYKVTIIAMILRFIVGPAVMAIGAFAVGLHGNVLRIAIIQSALPQAVAAFVWAKEYDSLANVLSTVVMISTIVSLPVSIAYYAIAESL